MMGRNHWKAWKLKQNLNQLTGIVGQITQSLNANHMNKLQLFVIWLDGYIDAVGEDGFNISKTNMVKNKLNDLFEHEADKNDEEPKKTLEDLGGEHGFQVNPGFPGSHHGFGRDENGVVYRC